VGEARRDLANATVFAGDCASGRSAPTGKVSGGAGEGGTFEKIAVRVARLQAELSIDEKEALKRLARELGSRRANSTASCNASARG